MTMIPLERSRDDALGSVPGLFIIYGASGDLAHRKLLPALYHLARDGLLDEHFAVIGAASTPYSDDSYREHLDRAIRESVETVDEKTWRWLLDRVSYVAGAWSDDGFYERLVAAISDADEHWQTRGNQLHYLAVPPGSFGTLTARLCHHGILERDHGARKRIVIEKPFGEDIASARALNSQLLDALDEAQIYRIDHYLGKETVQNLLVFRFANAIFEPVWNHHYVDHVQITVAEDQGIGHRARFYEDAGALRDMVPTHLMQLLALIAMEPPSSFNAEAVRTAKGEAMKSVVPLSHQDVMNQAVRGQYAAGRMTSGEEVVGYRQEAGTDEHSTTETFAALKLELRNWRWGGVPFYLRTGKRMPMRNSEILIQFKRAPAMMFQDTSVAGLTPNHLLLRIQPQESINLSFGAKQPGPTMNIANADLGFNYRERFGLSPRTGYETLLFDALRGDPTLYQRADSIEAGWGIVAPILEVWSGVRPQDFPNYRSGSWGPKAAEELMTRDGRQWKSEA